MSLILRTSACAVIAKPTSAPKTARSASGPSATTPISCAVVIDVATYLKRREGLSFIPDHAVVMDVATYLKRIANRPKRKPKSGTRSALRKSHWPR